MRLVAEFTRNTELIPYDYMAKQCGWFYKQLGITPAHDARVSLHSYSRIIGDVIDTSKGLYINNAHMYISCYDDAMYKKLCTSLVVDGSANFGMEVKAVTKLDTPKFDSRQFFVTGSGVLLRGKTDLDTGYRPMHTAADAEEITSNILTRSVKNKMVAAGVSGDVRVSFAKNIKQWRTKNYDFHGVHNRVSLHPIVVEGSPEAIEVAWVAGVGDLTGSGFGSLL